MENGEEVYTQASFPEKTCWEESGFSEALLPQATLSQLGLHLWLSCTPELLLPSLLSAALQPEVLLTQTHSLYSSPL